MAVAYWKTPAHGCSCSSHSVKRVDNGVSAIGEVRRISDGAMMAQAEGFVGDDEKMWGNRPEYAKRAMAQTRAISRACRSAFAHIVVMIDSNMATTPAEEMDGFDVPGKPEPQKQKRRPSEKEARQKILKNLESAIAKVLSGDKTWSELREWWTSLTAVKANEKLRQDGLDMIEGEEAAQATTPEQPPAMPEVPESAA